MWIENTWINLEWLTDITITLIQCFGCMTEKLLIKIISTVFPPLGLNLCPCVKFVDFCQEYRKKRLDCYIIFIWKIFTCWFYIAFEIQCKASEHQRKVQQCWGSLFYAINGSWTRQRGDLVPVLTGKATTACHSHVQSKGHQTLICLPSAYREWFFN